MTRRFVSLPVLLILGTLLTSGCAAGIASTGKPVVVITAPASNSEFRPGELVAVQSNSVDSTGIVGVQLEVDGSVLRTDTPPTPTPSFTVVQTWVATPGLHLLKLRAINGANVSSDPVGVYVSVIPVQDSPTPTPMASRTCVIDSAFVADLTLPGGIDVAPNQALNKIWRVRNTGTCPWNTDEQLVLVGGEAMTTTKTIAVPDTAPGATADLLVAIVAPIAPGVHASTWRMKNTSGVLFGATLDLKINVVNPAAVCPSTPVIESFAVSPTKITVGQSATLRWGAVKGAEKAEIDNDIGGVATPGKIVISPVTTTTYTLTATCGSKIRTAQVTITVHSASTQTLIQHAQENSDTLVKY